MKYIVDVPDNTKQVDAMYLWYPLKSYSLSELEPYTEPDRKAIEDEVWELTDRILRMSKKDTEQCFGYIFPTGITVNLSYQEAKSKYETWLKKKDEIKVGDEVIHNDEIKTVLCIFLGRLTLLDSDGHTYYVSIENENIEKTGKHHNEVAELLEKMRGEE